MKRNTGVIRQGIWVVCAVLVASAACTATAFGGRTDAAEASPVGIPILSGITIDGDPADWGTRGYRVEIIPDEDGRLLSAADFDPRLRLGWSDEGLLVLAEVTDDVSREDSEERYLWRSDCVELFVAPAVGGPDFCQLVIAPGNIPKGSGLRYRLYDNRSNPDDDAPLSTVQASSGSPGMYVVEILFPWKNLGIDPSEGREIGVQFVANDDDGDGASFRAAWYPSTTTHEDPRMMNAVRLAAAPSEPVTALVDRLSTLDGCFVTIAASSGRLGEPYAVTLTGGRVLSGVLGERDGRAGAMVDLGPGGDSGDCPGASVTVGGTEAGRFDAIPSMARLAERHIDAVGGRAAIERLGSRTARMLSYSEPLDGNGAPSDSSLSEICVDARGRWYRNGLGEGPRDAGGFDGETSWERDLGGIRRADLRGWSNTIWWIDPRAPLRLGDYWSGLRVIPPAEDDAKDIVRTEGRMPDGRTLTILFNRRSALITRIGRLHVTDYREIDGVRIPHDIYYDSRGRRTHFVLTDVRHDASVPDERFAMPDPRSEYPEVFGGIDDERVLPMLLDLPFEHGGMNVPPADGRFLYDLIVEHGYRRGLEIGTSNGYSTLWLGLAMRKTGGKVITIEYDEAAAREAVANFERAGLAGVIDARMADAFEEIPRIEGDFDFVFIDAWKPDYIRFLELIRDRVVPGGAIAAHNVTSQERDMRDFLEAIQHDAGLETTFHEPSTEGISMSIVK